MGRFGVEGPRVPQYLPARSLLGVLVKDLPRYVPAIWGRGQHYLAVHNRDEVLQAAPDGSGYRCDWTWTSDLHAPKVIPALGARIMGRALRDHPIRLSAAPARAEGRPQVSFIIGPTFRKRNDMLNLKARHNQMLRT